MRVVAAPDDPIYSRGWQIGAAPAFREPPKISPKGSLESQRKAGSPRRAGNDSRDLRNDGSH